MELRENDTERTDRDVARPFGVRALSPAAMAARRDTYRGFDDGLTMALELSITPVLFGLAGYGLDRWLGIVPVTTILFALFAVIGLSVRIWYGYEARMREHDAAGPWARAAPQSGEYRARAAPQSGEYRARAAPQSGEYRARASGDYRARSVPSHVAGTLEETG